MPGFDGTGPRGMGPMTGRGMGYCRPRRFYGRGMRYGFRYGRSRGFAYGPGVYALSPEEEKAMLEEEKTYLKARLDEVNKILEDFKKE
ncbi:hypothetical protein EDD65_10792 [Keratinibaculum paraultunense]|uniref:DUF5320 domain-containing protein n=1 Tax=Keratinibaculum paraultunense TaxID=1278232 RepID=A0A4R3KTS4_9FIRM|nr:DUF5320 domain-containing protein [Keratinibaculum paraultunense]QQY79854.1 DUF5320 domain-containing protein [Keratinibaculum paraultunense]TCS88737.1 hypothetical protein EDD65_10792 [Keratinibaculum paraultunense]